MMATGLRHSCRGAVPDAVRTDYRDVAAFRTGDTVVATVRFDQATCVLVTTPGIQDLHISINADGKTLHTTGNGLSKRGSAELVTMLKPASRRVTWAFTKPPHGCDRYYQGCRAVIIL